MTDFDKKLAEALEWAAPRVVMNDWQKSGEDQHFAILKQAAQQLQALSPALKEFREARERATQGEWTVTHNSWEVSTIYCDGDSVCELHINPDVGEETQDAFETITENNADFIVLAAAFASKLGEQE